MPELVKLAARDGVAILSLDRVDAHNAMNEDLLDSLARQVAQVACDSSVRAVVLTGSDRAFSVGGDLYWIAAYPDGAGAAVHLLAGRLHESIVSIRRMPKPVIAAVRGVAAGAGMSLALACDLRVIAEDARMVHAYTSRGFSVDGGASFSLPRLVGLGRSLEIIAFDEPIDAQRAHDWGLANWIAPASATLDWAIAKARQLAARPVNGFGHAKRLLTDSFHADLETQLEHEREALAQSLIHEEGARGLSDFVAS